MPAFKVPELTVILIAFKAVVVGMICIGNVLDPSATLGADALLKAKISKDPLRAAVVDVVKKPIAVALVSTPAVDTAM